MRDGELMLLRARVSKWEPSGEVIQEQQLMEKAEAYFNIYLIPLIFVFCCHDPSIPVTSN